MINNAVRIFVAINALLFLGFGAYAFVSPEALMEMMGASSMNSDGTYELRSNYGGVSFGIGLLCAAGVFRNGLRRPALFVLMTYTGGYALGRVLALPIDGVPSPNLIGFAVYEAVNAGLAAFLLTRLSAEANSQKDF